MLCGKVKKTNKQMTNLISKFSKFIEWLFPMRSAIRQEIDWITERCDKLEKRFEEMEKRVPRKSVVFAWIVLIVSTELNPKKNKAHDAARFGVN